ncbi:MAG: prefoldin subunit beta [Candidatus Woesearchaeota archaeon]
MAGEDKMQSGDDTSGENEKVSQLQNLEQNLQSFAMQKQNIQMQLMEVESALSEIEKTDSTYKIVGNVMVAAKKDDLKKELQNKQEMLNMRIKSVEKQEGKLREKASSMQSEVMGSMNRGQQKEGQQKG